jgi:hypothetical protein
MKHKRALCFLWVIIPLLATARVTAMEWDTFHGEDYEEPSGSYWLIEGDPEGNGYGLGAGSGAWIKGSPVCADYFASFLWNRKEDGLYGVLGITLRIMPHWRIAPFIGGGGTYDAILSRELEITYTPAEDEIKGKTYWGGHAEAGLRIKVAEGFCELLGRYTWPTSELEDADYATIRLAWSMTF